MNSRNQANHFIYATPPKPVYERDAEGNRVYRTVEDKLGDPMRIYREVWK